MPFGHMHGDHWGDRLNMLGYSCEEVRPWYRGGMMIDHQGAMR